ncbi:hypothetical protein ZPAH1_orf00308 [Aeromonas phage ZPAH1]|nr:hypothetical protein ASwh1_260 [Aeromonas phage Aswh_1]QQG34070.1 hypothetical protein ZPAH1_orf00308 [Aeromonas phage ZPAH1]
MQEQVQQLQQVILELKARIFDISEAQSRKEQEQAQIYQHFADALGLDKEEATRLDAYLAKIESLKAGQKPVVDSGE